MGSNYTFFFILTFFDHFRPSQKFFFFNALGFLNIHVKSFWKSGKNWNFGDFFNILTFLSFFWKLVYWLRINLKKIKIFKNSPKFQFLSDFQKLLIKMCGIPRAFKKKKKIGWVNHFWRPRAVVYNNYNKVSNKIWQSPSSSTLSKLTEKHFVSMFI